MAIACQGRLTGLPHGQKRLPSTGMRPFDE